MLSELMPIAALIGGLLTVGDLMRHRELVVIWSAGLDPLRVMRLVLPVAVGLTGAKLAIDDLALPRAAEALRAWGIGDYRHRPVEGQSGEYYWLRSGLDVVRISANAAIAGELIDLMIFRRTANDVLTETLEAKSGFPVAAGVELLDVTRRDVGEREVERVPALIWPGVIDLELVQLMARPARELPMGDLLAIVNGEGQGMRAVEPYATWLHLRIAGAFVPGCLLLIAFGLARRFGRTATLAPIFVTAVATGFGFIILGGVSSALGEVGFLPPPVAAWTPTLLLMLTVVALGRMGRVLPVVPASWGAA